jgi:hypothetical protein
MNELNLINQCMLDVDGLYEAVVNVLHKYSAPFFECMLLKVPIGLIGHRTLTC